MLHGGDGAWEGTVAKDRANLQALGKLHTHTPPNYLVTDPSPPPHRMSLSSSIADSQLWNAVVPAFTWRIFGFN